jgi:hypothetical protein
MTPQYFTEFGGLVDHMCRNLSSAAEDVSTRVCEDELQFRVHQQDGHVIEARLLEADLSKADDYQRLLELRLLVEMLESSNESAI